MLTDPAVTVGRRLFGAVPAARGLAPLPSDRIELSESRESAELLRLRRINRIRTIQGSLAIEGNTLSIEQITAILEGKRVIAPPREILEARNAIKASEYDKVQNRPRSHPRSQENAESY